MKKHHSWITRLAGILTGLIATGACSSDGDKIPTIDEILAIEKERLHEFLRGKTYTCYPYTGTDYRGQPFTDTLYILANDTTGTRPADRQFVLVDYDELAFNGIYLASTDPDRFVGQGIDAPYPLGGPITLAVNPGATNPPDPLSRALQQMSEGTTGEIIIPSTLAGRLAGNYFHARFQVWRVIPDLLAYEEKLVKEYIDTLGITTGITGEDIFERRDATGDTLTHVVITHRVENSTAPPILSSTRLKITHALYLLNEPALVTPPGFLKREVHAPAETTVTTSTFLPTPGAIERLRVGDEITVIFSFSTLEDESQAIIDTVTGEMMLPPYSTLVYKFKILDAE